MASVVVLMPLTGVTQLMVHSGPVITVHHLQQNLKEAGTFDPSEVLRCDR